MRWDIFCRVIDNHGDIGVCWRLARGLAQHGQQVRLWVDEPAALAWMAPGGVPGVQVQHWHAGAAGLAAADSPGAVVVEAFGCDPPPAFVARMAAMRPAPVWLNLEYLSAEPYAARCHGLPSPQSAGPGAGLVKWFFYPGFGAATGGLLHGDGALTGAAADGPEPAASATDSASASAAPMATAPAESAAGATAPAAREVLLFCYDNPQLPGLLQALASDGPALLRVPPGPAQAALGGLALPQGLHWQPQPLLSQPDFDHLLSACALNLVRGEDSFVRAQLVSNSPWLWQAYPQHDGAHRAKLEAFLALYLAQAPAALAAPLGQLFRAFNGLAPWPAAWPPAMLWAAHQQRWRRALLAQSDLLSRLLAFVADKAGAHGKTAEPAA